MAGLSAVALLGAGMTSMASPASAEEPEQVLHIGLNTGPGGQFSLFGRLVQSGFSTDLAPGARVVVRRLTEAPTNLDPACPRLMDGSLSGEEVKVLPVSEGIVTFTGWTTRPGTTWYYLHIEGSNGNPAICSKPVPLTLSKFETRTYLGGNGAGSPVTVAVGKPVKIAASSYPLSASPPLQNLPGTTTLTLNSRVIGHLTSPDKLWADWTRYTSSQQFRMAEPIKWRSHKVGVTRIVGKYAGSPMSLPSQGTLKIKVTKHPTKVKSVKTRGKTIVRGKKAVVVVKVDGTRYTKGGKVTLLFGGRLLKTTPVRKGVAKVKLSKRITKQIPQGRVRLVAEFRGTKSSKSAKRTATARVR